MRFISDDNKVFNTLEECKEHEENLKRESDEKREERRKEVLNELQDRHKDLIDKIDKWLDDYNNYMNEYKDSESVKKRSETKDDLFDLRDFMKFLDIVFGEYDK